MDPWYDGWMENVLCDVTFHNALPLRLKTQNFGPPSSWCVMSFTDGPKMWTSIRKKDINIHILWVYNYGRCRVVTVGESASIAINNVPFHKHALGMH